MAAPSPASDHALEPCTSLTNDVWMVSPDGGPLPHVPRALYGDRLSVVRPSWDQDSHGVHGQHREVGKPAPIGGDSGY